MDSVGTETLLKDLLAEGEEVLAVLREYHLACAECLGAGFETVGDAIRSHKLPEEEVLNKLRKAISFKG